MDKVQISMPYIFNVTNNGSEPPAVVFAEEQGRVVSVIPDQLYNNIVQEIAEKPTIIGMIRLDLFDCKVEDVSIGFRRKINGEVIEKIFIAPYFLEMRQFVMNVIQFPINLPLDGKTEIVISAPGKVRISLYPNGANTDVDYDELFLSAINSGWLYDDCIQVSNTTEYNQRAELHFTDKGVVCVNQELKVSSAEKYLREDKIYFRKVFSESILSVISKIENGQEAEEILIYLALNSFQTKVVDILGRREVNLTKTIAFNIAPQSTLCLFVTKNKRPLYRNYLCVSHYADMDFNSASEVRQVLDGINKQKSKLELLLEKNDFVINEPKI